MTGPDDAPADPGDDAGIDPLALAVLSALAGVDEPVGVDEPAGAADRAMSVARLRKRLDVRQSALARILSALVDAGLVDVHERQPGQPVAVLTPDGAALARGIFGA